MSRTYYQLYTNETENEKLFPYVRDKMISFIFIVYYITLYELNENPVYIHFSRC